MSDTPETDDQSIIYAINDNGYQVPCVEIEFARKLEQERDEARELLASEKITRDHVIKRGIEMQKERDEARDDLKITQQEWVRARRERAQALRERDEAKEALREIWQSGDAFLPYVDAETINRWRKAAGWEGTK